MKKIVIIQFNFKRKIIKAALSSIQNDLSKKITTYFSTIFQQNYLILDVFLSFDIQ